MFVVVVVVAVVIVVAVLVVVLWGFFCQRNGPKSVRSKKWRPEPLKNGFPQCWAALFVRFCLMFGTLVGATLEPLGKHLGHMLPKDWILEAPGTALGAPNYSLGSNLEVQDPPK